MDIRQMSPRSYHLRKGQTILCTNGSAWITAEGRDIILEKGESYHSGKNIHHAVVCPLGTPEIALSIQG